MLYFIFKGEGFIVHWLDLVCGTFIPEMWVGLKESEYKAKKSYGTQVWDKKKEAANWVIYFKMNVKISFQLWSLERC